jgi:mannose-6-phosphate isomerase
MITPVSPYPIKFCSQPMERIWGGRRLAQQLMLAAAQPIGEVWTLSGHPSAVSVCQNGPWAGLTLPQIVAAHPDAYLGRADSDPFPVLVKFIDAASILSVQVHPDDQVAARLCGQRGKTESWYVTAVAADARVIVGLELSSAEQLRQAVVDGRLEENLVYRSVAPGDLVHIPAGTVHALCGGVQVVEIQQCSDLTFRLFDWNRVGVDGLPRQLHIEQALQAIHFGAAPCSASAAVVSAPLSSGASHLIQCESYAIDELRLTRQTAFPTPGRPLVLIVVRGQGQLQFAEHTCQLRFGDTFLLPSSGQGFSLQPEGQLTALLVAYS